MEGVPVHLIVMIGAQHAARAALAAYLAGLAQARGHSVTLLDNCDTPLHLAGVPRVRLAGGCVCCGLAEALIPAVWRL
ncbi:MAG: hypothetical protein MUE40_19935, partial [Anaerolineae bacterium]|nr:hypothetical protein [Anaerolineae bacterium]